MAVCLVPSNAVNHHVHEAGGTGWFFAASWANRSVFCSMGCR